MSSPPSANPLIVKRESSLARLQNSLRDRAIFLWKDFADQNYVRVYPIQDPPGDLDIVHSELVATRAERWQGPRVRKRQRFPVL